MIAAQMGNLELVNLLLAHGANARLVGPKDRTPLHFAVRKADNLPVCRRLREAGAEINAADDEGSTPLFDAVRSNQIEVVQWLLDNHAEVSRKDKQGHTVLYYANFDAMRIRLVQGGAVQ